MEVSSTDNDQLTLVSFRIFAPGLNPQSVTEKLGIEPDHMHLEGDYPRGNPKYSAYKQGMWLLRSKLGSSDSVEKHLEHLLSILEPKRDAIISLSTSADVNFSFDLFNLRGFQLSAQLLGRIADLGASLGGTVYPPDASDELPPEH